MTIIASVESQRTHMPDALGPLGFQPRDAGGQPLGPKLILHVRSCAEPECACIDTDLFIARADDEASKPNALVQFDPLTAETVLKSDPDGILAEGFESLKGSLQGDLRELFRARALRAKQRAEVRPWRQRELASYLGDGMVPMLEIAAGEPDLIVDVDGERYWVEDMYCIEPGCSCETVACEIHGLTSAGLGHVRIDLAKQRVTEHERPKGAAVARALLEVYDFAFLRERRRIARQLAADLEDEKPKPAPLHVPAKVGRNALCPCGSGRKHKHCCARAGK